MRGASTLSRVVTALLVLSAGAGVSGNGNGVALRLHGAIEPVRSHPVVALAAPHHEETVPSWEIGALAASAAVCVVVTTRRWRRRASRLSLPPL